MIPAAAPHAAEVRAVPVDVVAGETGVWLLSRRVRVTGAPGAPVIAPAGARLSRIDPATGAGIRRIDLDVDPEALVQGRTGRLWLTGRRLVVVDPRTGAVRPGRGLPCVARVADGRPGVWAWSPCARSLVRLSADGRPSGPRIRLQGAPVAELAVGADGLFVARRAGAAAVLERRDPHDGHLLRRVRVGGPPDGLALRGGSVWALGGGTGTLDRLDPLSLRRTARIRLGFRAPGAAHLAVGGGAAWVVDPWAPAIVRVDPRTENPARRALAGLPAATIPVAVATGPRAAWLVARSDGTRGALCRLEPRDGAVRWCLTRSR